MLVAKGYFAMKDTYSDYYDSAENTAITRKDALRLLARHHIDDVDEFFHDLGECDIYQAQAVLRCLGY